MGMAANPFGVHQDGRSRVDGEGGGCAMPSSHGRSGRVDGQTRVEHTERAASPTMTPCAELQCNVDGRDARVERRCDHPPAIAGLVANANSSGLPDPARRVSQLPMGR